MFKRSTGSGSFSEVPLNQESWLGRLTTSRQPALPARWHNPQESVGKRCWNFGDHMFWEIKDPGRKKLEPLEADVQRLLNDQNEYLKLREACNLSFSIFMVGRQETTSCLTLVIISANTVSRKKVVDAIRGSRILDKYEGVLLGQSSRHPRHPHSGPPKQIASGMGQGSSQAAEIGLAVYVKKPGLQLLSGTAIYIPVDDSNPCSWTIPESNSRRILRVEKKGRNSNHCWHDCGTCFSARGLEPACVT